MASFSCFLCVFSSYRTYIFGRNATSDPFTLGHSWYNLIFTFYNEFCIDIILFLFLYRYNSFFVFKNLRFCTTRRFRTTHPSHTLHFYAAFAGKNTNVFEIVLCKLKNFNKRFCIKSFVLDIFLCVIRCNRSSSSLI